MKFKLLTLLFVCIMESVLYNLDAKNYTTSATMDYVLITRTGTNKYKIEMYDTSQDNTSPFWTLTNVSITSTTLPTTQLTSSKNTNNIVYVNNTTGENNVSGIVTFTYLGNKYFQVTATASSSSNNHSWSSTGVYVDLPTSYLKYPTFTETIANPDGDGVISGCYAHFPFATSGITISSTQTTGANYGNPSGLNYLSWNPNDTQRYLRLTAYNSNRNTRNYLFMTFRNITTRNYNNGNGGTIIGPEVGTYQITGQSYIEVNTGEFWYSTSGGIVGDSLFFFKNYGLYWNYIGSIIGNATSNTRPKDNLVTTKKLDYTYTYNVAEGKNGQMYLTIKEKSSNRIFITIGEPKEYTITYNKGSYGSETTIANGTKTSGVNFTLSSSTYTRTGYTQTGWSTNSNGSTKNYNLGGTYTANADLTLYPYWSPNTNTAYTVKHYKQQLDGTYSATPDETDNQTGTTATNVTPDVKSYTGFTAPAAQTVSILADGSRVVEYQYTRNRYALTWNLAGGTITTAGTAAGDVLYEASISAPTVERVGYTFAGWDSDIATTMPAAPLTYTASWSKATTLDLYDDENADYYNAIKTLGNTSLSEIERTYSTITYHRSAAYTSDNGNARWYTLCLPFDVDQSQLDINGLTGKVYEYRYAEGSADENDHVTFHFRTATSMIAGRGYLVKATGDMGPDFEFIGVTLDTDKDTETDVNDLKFNSANAYNESGDIAIVGVLRSGTLRNDDRKVMGLANNKIWYPHSSGNPMPAYRAYFYNPNASASSVMPRVRIVVEGEGTTELEVVDGELYDAGGDRQAYRAPRKYIRNGVLIIERNGVRYDAQGKRI